jgi:DDE superfamily endonuclease
VARQYTGTAGDTANAQVGVFLAYASENGAASFLDRVLYLPEEWTEDPDRRAEARVPETVGFASKVVLAKRMLERALKAGIPAKWVVTDSFYGRSHGFRRWLEQKGRPYVVMVPKTNTVRCAGRRTRIERLAERLPEDAWGPRPIEEVAPGGKRPWEWACSELSEDGRRKMRRWLLVSRNPHEPNALALYQAYGPGGHRSEPRYGRVRRGGRWRIASPRPKARSGSTNTR